MSHTPGPWRVDGLLIKALDHGKWFGIAKAGGTRLAIEGNIANARLIAAAPDLLAALQHLIDAIGVDHNDDYYISTSPGHDPVEEANAVIAKAKGQS